MSLLHLFTVPLLGLCGLALVGIAPAASLNRLATDVRAALVLPLGAAIIACASSLTLLGVPVRWAGVALGLASVTATFATSRRIKPLARSLAAPAAVALVAFSLASIPSLSDHTWDASSTGNGDLYYWVSQSQSFLHGPPPAPSAEYPDRSMYELVKKQHSPFGIAFSLSMLSLATSDAPVAVYSAFASFVHVILALVVFALARSAFRWTRLRSATAAILISGNAYLLFSTFFGWQAQLLITSFGLLALSGTYCALERGATRDFVLLGGLGAAAGIASYGAVFAPFLILGGVVIAAYAALHRDRHSLRRVAQSVGAIALLTLVLGAVPIFRALMFAGSLANGSVTTSWCLGCSAALPSEPLGLAPRIDENTRSSGAWTLLSLAIALPLYALGLLRARHEEGKAILLWGSGAAFVAIVLLSAFGPNPYLSIKLAGYAAPLLMLTVIGARREPACAFRWVWVVVASLASTMFILSSAIVELQAVHVGLHAQKMAGLASAARLLPADARVRVDVEDAWRQSWALYYLRDRRVLIRHPQYFVPKAIAAAQKSSPPTQYVLGKHASGRVIWRGAGLVLSATTKASSDSAS